MQGEPQYTHDATDPYAFTDKAKALFLYGTEIRPRLVLNQAEYDGPMAELRLGGHQGWLVPLFGVTMEEAREGLAERFAVAQERAVDPEVVAGGMAPHP